MSGFATGGRARLAIAADAGGPLLCAIVAFALARATLLPGLAFWDTGEFQVVGPLLGTAHPTGYPAYVLLGWLASIVLEPFGEPAFRMNLLSALLFAGAAGLTTILVRALTGRPLVGLAAGILLSVTPLPWRMGTHADPHTFHLFLVALLLVLLVGWEDRRRGDEDGADRWLVAAAATYGVALGNHSLTILLAPAIGLFVLAVEPRIVLRLRFLTTCAAVLVGVAALLYLELPVRAAMGAPLVYGRPDTWDGFRYIIVGEQFRGAFVDPWGDLGRKLGDLVALASAQLGPLAVVVPAGFVAAALRRPRYALLSFVAFAATTWFSAAYVNAAIERYYLGPVLLAVTWLGLGAGALADVIEHGPAWAPGRGRPGATASSMALSGRVAELGLAALLVLPGLIALPATARSVDRSGDRLARAWVDGVLATVPRDSLVISWWSFSTPLWYATLVEGARPDVTVLDDRNLLDLGLGSVGDVVEANLGRRPVFLVRESKDLPPLEARFILEAVAEPTGVQSLWRVVGLRATGASPAVPTSVRARAAAAGAGMPAPPCRAGTAGRRVGCTG